MLPPNLGPLHIEDADSREILRIVTGGDYQVSVTEWTYESRRQFQSVLEFLYLGPFTAAKNIPELKKAGITMLLVIRNTRSAMSGLFSGKKVADQLGIEHASVDLEGNAELINSGFGRAIRLINEHLISKYRELATDKNHVHSPDGKPPAWGKVLVFCESGNERSAAVVVAYLTAMYDIDAVSAMQYLQARRFCIAFDDPMKLLLCNYYELLQARKTVHDSQSHYLQISLPSRSSVAPKRRRDEIDSDVSMSTEDAEDEDDAARFENRRSFAPFYSN